MPKSPEAFDRKPKRSSRPKVRTGCVTCKIRRTKCDEGKPECLRCTSTGRRCDGYLPPKAWLFESRGELRPSASTLLPGTPAWIGLHGLEENRALQFYHEKTGPTIGNYNSPHFWRVTVPLTAQSHPPIKHTIIAIAYLHESLEQPQINHSGLCRLRFMENYSKAVSLITNTPTNLAIEVVLICCLLFGTCENFQGETMTGLLHVVGGAKILREWRASAPQRLIGTVPQTRRSDLIEGEIAPIFERLESYIHASRSLSLGHQQGSHMPSPPDGAPDTAAPGRPSIPDEYGTFSSARDHLNDSIQWMSRALQWDGLAPTTTNVDLVATAKEAKDLLSRWVAAFDRFKPQPGGMREKDFLRRECLLLRTHHRAATIMVESLPSTSEMVFDKWLDSFKVLLGDCSAAAIPSPSQSIAFDFGFSLGLISPLFLVATRCRDPMTRKEAVAVLRSMHRSEGCWDSCSAALIAEHVIHIEERGLTIIQSMSDVTTFSRIRLIGVQADYPNQKLILRVAHFSSDLLNPPIEDEKVEWSTVVDQDRDTVEWPLDKILVAAGYQGIIRPEQGICRHTAALSMGEDVVPFAGR